MIRVRAAAARNIKIAAARINKQISKTINKPRIGRRRGLFPKQKFIEKFIERSEKMLEYEQYRLELQGLEENIKDLRDSL